jgi:DNA-binding Lrp family transcriptional regulator
MSSVKLDKLDKRILYELDLNSRQTSSEIARKVKQGRDRIEYRIDRLIDLKVVRKFTTSVNLSSLGYTIYKMYIRIDAGSKKVQDFIAYLRKHNRVYWIALSDGSWDLMIAIFARSGYEYVQTQQEILSSFNSVIVNFQIFQLIELDVYNKHYLVGTGERSVLVGGEQVQNEIDEIDIKILKEISNNSRRSNVELADKVSSTPAIIKGRIDKMLAKGIITGFRVEVDLPTLGMESFKTQLFLRSYDPKSLNKLRLYCKRDVNITYFIQQIGSCSLEIESEVEGYDHYHRLIENLRQEFPSYIRNFQTVLIRKTYFNWVPRDLNYEN